MRLAQALAAATTAAAVSFAPSAAEAFCGFYVAGADAELYNNATMVVMMRDGTRTVLSMQNNYQGPPSDFAMVVPVPVVLQKENVKTLEAGVFSRVDRLAAPRLVEYWEMDPCAPIPPPEAMPVMSGAGPVDEMDADGGGDGVKIEAQFTVGEYEIVVLSASDSTGLDRWLRRNQYKIPAGAEKLLRPYVAAGMKFFVAKVDIEKVKRVGDKTMLSPLRFHYDAEQFNLPVRLGMINSSGTQDLLVHILAPGMRYEVANYPNVTIPTNLDVSDETRESFGAFFAALFDATLEKHPGAVVTEYSWDAASCDPCPTPPLSFEDLVTLGDDVIGKGSYVLTRLHARYGKGALGEDLVFRESMAIAGGREHVVGAAGQVERGAVKSHVNNFQGRYIIRHAWEGAIDCEDPIRGRWGGPPEGGPEKLEAATDVAFAPRGAGITLGSFLRQDVAEIDFKVSEADENAKFRPGGIPPKPKKSGCAGCAAGGAPIGGVALLLLGIAVFWRRRRS
jgi:MYXO-CTERM domain-containing protein